MSALQCLSCDYDNALGANFCQECGSPLHLRLCKRCEAINDIAAPSCHSCDALFAPPSLQLSGVTSKLRFSAGRVRPLHAVFAGLLLAAIIGAASYAIYGDSGASPVALEPAVISDRPTSAPAEVVVKRPVSTPTRALAATGAAVNAGNSTASATRTSPAPVTHTRSAVPAPAVATRTARPAAPVSNGAPQDGPADTAASGASQPSLSPVTHTKRAVVVRVEASPELKQVMEPAGGNTIVNIRPDEQAGKGAGN